MRLLKSVSQLGKQRHKTFLGKKGQLAVVLQYLKRSGLCPVSSSFPMLNKIKQRQGTFQDNKYQDTYNSCFIYQIRDPNILHFGKKNILKSEMSLQEYKLRLSAFSLKSVLLPRKRDLAPCLQIHPLSCGMRRAMLPQEGPCSSNRSYLSWESYFSARKSGPLCQKKEP